MYHVALRDEWDAAQAGGVYRRSTLGKSLDQVGFIHCSFADQVHRTAERFYAGRDDVVVLEIDPRLVPAEIVSERVGDNVFPHIYSPLRVDAVSDARELSARRRS